MRKGILDVSLYDGHEKELMMGALSSLAGSGIWLLLATALRLPISGTHSIVGATVGFSLVCRGTSGVRDSRLEGNVRGTKFVALHETRFLIQIVFSFISCGTQVRWMALANIAASWFASPLLSGIVSVSIFWIIRKSVLRAEKPIERGLNILPIAYGLTIAVNVMSVVHDGPKCTFYLVKKKEKII